MPSSRMGRHRAGLSNHCRIANTPDGETVDNVEVLDYNEDDNPPVIGCRGVRGVYSPGTYPSYPS